MKHLSLKSISPPVAEKALWSQVLLSFHMCFIFEAHCQLEFLEEATNGLYFQDSHFYGMLHSCFSCADLQYRAAPLPPASPALQLLLPVAASPYLLSTGAASSTTTAAIARIHTPDLAYHVCFLYSLYSCLSVDLPLRPRAPVPGQPRLSACLLS